MSFDVDRSVTSSDTDITDRRTNIDLGRGSYTIAPKGAITLGSETDNIKYKTPTQVYKSLTQV